MPRSAMSSADAISARLRDLELLTKGPAWALTRSAPWVIAVLQASFTRTRPQLPLEEFHADVDAFLEQLRRQDPGAGWPANGKSLRRRMDPQAVPDPPQPVRPDRLRSHRARGPCARVPGQPFQRPFHAERFPAGHAAGRRREARQRDQPGPERAAGSPRGGNPGAAAAGGGHQFGRLRWSPGRRGSRGSRRQHPGPRGQPARGLQEDA